MNMRIQQEIARLRAELECKQAEFIARMIAKPGGCGKYSDADHAEATALKMSLPDIPRWSKLPERRYVK